MKAYKLHAPKSLDHFLLGEYDEPGVGARQVKVQVKAVSLNFRDWGLAKGIITYPGESLPFIPFSDAGGLVTAVGEGVKNIKVGDRVAAGFFPQWHAGKFSREKTKHALGGTQDGVLAEYIVLDELSVVKIPEFFSYAEGAAFPCAGVTAWHALAVQAQLKPGDTVLLLGTGGVSVFGLQIAKLYGATVIITSSSEDKLAKAKALGADHTINYLEENWEERVKSITNGNGADYVVDVVGHLADTLNVVKPGGSIFMIGGVGGPADENNKPNLRQVTVNMNRLQGIFVGSVEMLKDVFTAFSGNQLKPVIDETFEFGQVMDAMQYLGQGSHFGKIIVNI